MEAWEEGERGVGTDAGEGVVDEVAGFVGRRRSATPPSFTTVVRNKQGRTN